MTSKEWIESLELQPHPEGGFYRETYRAAEMLEKKALPDRFSGPRAFSTAIYFLLRGNDFSALHRIAADEVWHFHAGCPLLLHRIDGEGHYVIDRLGTGVGQGEMPQAVVPAGTWFGATPSDPSSFSLTSCTVAPGFDFADLEIGRREDLLKAFPQHQVLIERLTRP